MYPCGTSLKCHIPMVSPELETSGAVFVGRSSKLHEGWNILFFFGARNAVISDYLAIGNFDILESPVALDAGLEMGTRGEMTWFIRPCAERRRSGNVFAAMKGGDSAATNAYVQVGLTGQGSG